MKNILFRYILIFFLIIPFSEAFTQSKATISGIVKDAATNEALPFANISLKYTSTGTVSMNDGSYTLSNVSPGNYTIVFSYLSYGTVEQEINVKAGDQLTIDISLRPQSIMGEEVTITAMLKGQTAAINKQVKASSIVNVISKEKIMELPDQNAAETVSRLSGVSVVRDGGEGSKVTLRGLAPRFNSITLDGEKVPSTDAQDRSVDLTMFSTAALSGIELYKAILPDMDGDAIGGQINFVSRTASSGFKGKVKVQTGYNQIREEFGQYKGSLSLENRFFDDKLGVILGTTYQKANRSSQGYSGSWNNDLGRDSDGNLIFSVSNLNVTDIIEDRNRFNANSLIDYKMKNGTLILSTNYGETNREQYRRRRRYRVDASYLEYDFRERRSDNSFLSNRLSANFRFFDRLDVDGAVTYSKTVNDRPFVSRIRFRELGAYNTGNESSYADIIASAKNNMDATWLKDAYFDDERVDDKNTTFFINLKMDFTLHPQISGYIKTGAKYRDKKRSSDVNRDYTEHFVAQEILDAGLEDPSWDIDYSKDYILMSSFLGDYSALPFNRFFDLPLFLGPGTEEVNGPHLDKNKVESFRTTYNNFYVPYPQIDLSDYEADERIMAGYLMSELKFFNKMTLIGGVRYEHTQNNYQSIYGSPIVDEDGIIVNQTGLVDTVGQKNYGEWLPMIHLKYDIARWSNIRLAYTKTLSRPNFFSLVPWERINKGENTAERGDPNLKHMTSQNFDAILSFYGKMGLFTLGGFYKEVENIDYTLTSRIFDPDSPIYGLDLTRPVNADRTSTILGFEVDMQTNLRFLPGFLSGIVLSANYTHLNSTTYYPISIIEQMETFPYTSTIIDTIREGRMPGQVDDLINISFGYEHKGFSARLSMIYQGESLFVDEESDIGQLAHSIGIMPELDNYVASSIRWDLAVKQKIKKQFEIFLFVNNLTNTPEKTFVAGSIDHKITNHYVYGLTADLGFSYKF